MHVALVVLFAVSNAKASAQVIAKPWRYHVMMNGTEFRLQDVVVKCVK